MAVAVYFTIRARHSSVAKASFAICEPARAPVTFISSTAGRTPPLADRGACPDTLTHIVLLCRPQDRFSTCGIQLGPLADKGGWGVG